MNKRKRINFGYIIIEVILIALIIILYHCFNYTGFLYNLLVSIFGSIIVTHIVYLLDSPSQRALESELLREFNYDISNKIDDVKEKELAHSNLYDVKSMVDNHPSNFAPIDNWSFNVKHYLDEGCIRGNKLYSNKPSFNKFKNFVEYQGSKIDEIRKDGDNFNGFEDPLKYSKELLNFLKNKYNK